MLLNEQNKILIKELPADSIGGQLLYPFSFGRTSLYGTVFPDHCGYSLSSFSALSRISAAIVSGASTRMPSPKLISFE